MHPSQMSSFEPMLLALALESSELWPLPGHCQHQIPQSMQLAVPEMKISQIPAMLIS